MQNDLTPTSTSSRPASLFSASSDYRYRVLNTRCDQGRLIEDLRDLLSLYYQPNETPEQRARQIALFVKDLADMSDDCVGYAIETWRRTQDRRPSPASLRQLCMVRRQEAVRAGGGSTAPGVVSQPIAPSADKPEDIAERQAVIDQAAKACGMVKHAGRWTSPRLVDEEQQERVPHWSETAPPDHPWRKALDEARARNPLVKPL